MKFVSYVGAPLRSVDRLIVAAYVDAALRVVSGRTNSAGEVSHAADRCSRLGTREPGIVLQRRGRSVSASLRSRRQVDTVRARQAVKPGVTLASSSFFPQRRKVSLIASGDSHW